MTQSIRTRRGIEVFVNEEGDIAITQERTDSRGGEKEIIVVHPGDIEKLIDMLGCALRETNEADTATRRRSK